MNASEMELEHWLEECSRAFERVAAGHTDTEFDWFALDAAGCLACFLSGGYMAIPPEVIADKVGYLRLCEAVHRLVRDKKWVKEGNYVGEEWVDYGSRGLFVFDVPRDLSKDVYERVVVPERPVYGFDCLGWDVLSAVPILEPVLFADVRRVAV